MALFLGSSKTKVALDNAICLTRYFLPSSSPEIKLLSLDNFILTDLNGNILIAKEAE